MNGLGHTRSTRQLTHLLHTPDAFVRTPLPGLQGGMAIIHAAPALGARFVQYTGELAAGGTLRPCEQQRFLYVLEGAGTLRLDSENYSEGAPQTHSLRPGAYAYLPAGELGTVLADNDLRIAVIEKCYERLAGVPAPKVLFGQEKKVTPQALGGDPGLLVRSLLPTDFAFDFAVNTMEYAAGAALGQVEVHVMEHGLLMLAGEGSYRLGDTFYPVAAGDFIWMAPFCPQWFGALGDEPAKYLIYKDWNRVPTL